jgi:hypothetical protein
MMTEVYRTEGEIKKLYTLRLYNVIKELVWISILLEWNFKYSIVDNWLVA